MALPSASYISQARSSNFGFDHVPSNSTARRYVEIPIPLPLPVKSTTRLPASPGRNIESPASLKFQQEELLEKYEQRTENEQAKDLKIKTRVRVAKFVLRSVNFGCSLTILAMLSMTFAIFNKTKHLAPQNNFPPWAQGQKTWPQITVLVIACISLAFCLLIFWSYWREGHRKAEKVAVYYTIFAIAFFIFSIVMWASAAAILRQSKNSGRGKDMWGWSCVDNHRRELFQEEVDYELICRMQSWSLICCLVEIVLECITILLYSVVFYRYYSKQRLRKSMDVRDRARSDVYLTQLRSHSALGTPHVDPRSPYYQNDPAAEEGFGGAQSVKAKSNSAPNTNYFVPQLTPTSTYSHTPKAAPNGFARAPHPPVERRTEYGSATIIEQTYDAVPIPKAYALPQQVNDRNGSSLGAYYEHYE